MNDDKMEIENKIWKSVPVLPLRGLVIFPGTILHFDVTRNKSLLALSEAMRMGQHVFITAQIDFAVTDPMPSDLYTVGVYAKVLQIVKMSDDLVRVVAEGKCRASAVSIREDGPYFTADLVKEETIRTHDPVRAEAMINVAKENISTLCANNPQIPRDYLIATQDMDDIGQLADYIADNILRNYHKKQEILSTFNELERLTKANEMLLYELELLSIEAEIYTKTKEFMDKGQKEYYLKERLRAIHEELGDDPEDTEESSARYHEAIDALQTTQENKEKLHREVRKLEKMAGSMMPEANVTRNYLDACLHLPWGVYTKEKIDISRMTAKLDKNHYGLKKVKESVIEALAVRKLNPDSNGQIICLAGPPGVGKTSIAHSIADAIGRKYQRIALGGVHDESEIRGHRRTYIGAMMGRIMYAIDQAGSANPLILLDEVDKLGNDFHGDPTSALLEVLDGEQNSTFFDHYIDLPFDLSKVMFITTANDYTRIPAPLLDRMDIIHVDSYTREEKYQIAKRHLISKQLKKHGLSARQCKIQDDVIYRLIDSYTRESGVRNLERCISTIMNKVAVKIVSGEQKTVKVSLEEVEHYLGAEKYKLDELSRSDEVGLVTGLAWTSVGGDTLPVEVAVMSGSGKIELTGSLGDVMKESAQAAITVVRTMCDELRIDPSFYQTKDIHVHVPEGAVPKDGPSAGVTIATAIASALTGLPVRRDLAMTGEITIRGRVLPIGGLKEKTMAAYRLGIKTIILPEANRPDIDEVDEVVKNQIEFVYVNHINDVLARALVGYQTASEGRA